MSELLVRNAERILASGPSWEAVRGDLLVRDGRVVAIGGDLRDRASDGARVLHASGLTVMPGLVQTHVHVCQTLFRGFAEDRPLLPWLRERIWPFEAAHDPDSLRASAELSVLELLLGGTTTILDMGTTHHHGVVFESFEAAGIRAVSGKAMMDEGDGVPVGLLETTLDSLRESFDLAEKWHGAAGGRLRYAFAPRFVLSCSDVLFREVVALAKERYLLHTHASESRDESAAVSELKGCRNVEYLDRVGFLGKGTLLAHCIWLEDEEIEAIARSGTKVLHCPQTNLKLGSGMAPVRRLLDAGVSVSIGCDGAPANNTLDAFAEMRVAAHVGTLLTGPASLRARDVLTMATLGGAAALCWDDEIGSLEPGKAADFIAVDLNTPHAAPTEDPVTALVYSARASDVRHVAVAGELLVEDGVPVTLRPDDVIGRARAECAKVRERAKGGCA